MNHGWTGVDEMDMDFEKLPLNISVKICVNLR